MINIFRNGLGYIIAFIAYIIPVSKVKRSSQEQTRVDEETMQYELYQFFACPFCIITRRTIRRLRLNIITRDAQGDTPYRAELLAKGGKIQVPCLKITEGESITWMYESADIKAFLEQKYR